ncbi:hypothetical protein ACA910_010634 [Epithemia clementina (nom. ined.)]
MLAFIGRGFAKARRIQSSHKALSSVATPSTSHKVKIVEVGPRDGLQNETKIVGVEDKVTLITKLADAGCKFIETGSFVSPKWVPTMANTSEVMERLKSWKEQEKNSDVSRKDVVFSCLVPNLNGLEQAAEAGDILGEIAIFASASEEFSKRNINCSINESMERFKAVTDTARERYPYLKIRGYLSCVIACPYEGLIAPKQVAKIAEKMLGDLGCHELSLGDTIGVGTPGLTIHMLKEVQSAVGSEKTDTLAVHFHDTYGQALANILIALDHDIHKIDSSVAGLGGCPYATGSSGNVATEDVVYMLHGLGVETGIDLIKLSEAGAFISKTVLGQPTRSKVGLVLDTDSTKLLIQSPENFGTAIHDFSRNTVP